MSNFLQEVYNSPEFQKLKATHPECAESLMADYKRSYTDFLKYQHTFNTHKQALKEVNKRTPGWGDGKVAGTFPEVVLHWLKERASLRGEDFTKDDLMAYLKRHPEWHTVDNL